MSQQEFSYFDPEQETDYKPRNINEDPRESYEYQEEQEQEFYYVTPEQSMLKGEKLVPVDKTSSYSNWVLTAVFLLMILLGGLIWSTQARPQYSPVPSQYNNQFHKEYNWPPPHDWGYREKPMPPGDNDGQ